MPERPLWISEDQVKGLISPLEAIEVLAAAYKAKANGEAASMRRAHLRVGDAILHAVGGSLGEERLTGTKTWTYTPGGAAPLLILFSLDDGAVRAVIEAFSLGQLRTSATSGLGTSLLARENASVLALVGTGKQAFSQAQMVLAVRPIRTVRLFGRDRAKRALLAERIESELGVEVLQFGEVAAAMAGADVVTAVTRSAEPIIDGTMIAAGTHVNAVGAIVPTRRELTEDAVSRCDTIVADSLEQARDDAGELRAAVEAGALEWSRVSDLSDVVGRSVTDLRSDSDITLFKALGVGLADVALGAAVLRRVTADPDG